jgi:MFS family permease
MALDAASFIPSAVGVALIRAPEAVPVSPSHGRNIWREIGAGLRFVAGHRLLRPIAITSAVSNLFGSVFGAMYEFYLVKELGIAPAQLGALEVVRYAGFFLGTLLAAPLVQRFGLGTVATMGMALLGLGWAPTSMVADRSAASIGSLIAGGLVTGLGNTLYNVNATGLRQMVTPDPLLGRMHTVFRFAGRGAIPVGALLGGVLGELLGVRTTLAVGVIGMLAAPVWLALSPVAKVRSLPLHGEGK